MKVLKKSALSLAVAGVVYGTALTPVYATDVSTNTKGSAVGIPITDNVMSRLLQMMEPLLSPLHFKLM